MRQDLSHLISKVEALRRLFEKWNPIPETETVSLLQANGRVLAENQYAKYDLPVYRASTMDGIAVRSADFADGIPDTSNWILGQDYVRADTGDDFPDGFDAVIAIEDVTQLETGGIAVASDLKIKPGTNVKPQGADVHKGALLAEKGRILRPQDVAAIAMGGYSQVEVLKKPCVAFLPTGSELVPAGADLCRGQNFDTNSIMVAQLLRDMGAEPILHPICRDDPAELRQALFELLPQADMILVNAGTSKGGEDYSARLLAEQGEVLFHGVAAVPGRPMSIAIIQGKPVVNLSGPSFACFYSMDWAVRALVCRYLHIPVPQRPTIQAVLTQNFQTPRILSMMSAFHVQRQGDGAYSATPIPLRGPAAKGAVGPLTANAVYISQLGEKPHKAGETITVELVTNIGWI